LPLSIFSDKSRVVCYNVFFLSSVPRAMVKNGHALSSQNLSDFRAVSLTHCRIFSLENCVFRNLVRRLRLLFKVGDPSPGAEMGAPCRTSPPLGRVTDLKKKRDTANENFLVFLGFFYPCFLGPPGSPPPPGGWAPDSLGRVPAGPSPVPKRSRVYTFVIHA